MPQFRAFVKYNQPSVEELKSRFGSVDREYVGLRFDPIKGDQPVSTEDRELIFEHFSMFENSSTDEVLEWMGDCLRPALYEELLAFGEKYPSELHGDPIIALGSESKVRGSRVVPFFEKAWMMGGSSLRLFWVGEVWHHHCRFLAVCKLHLYYLFLLCALYATRSPIWWRVFLFVTPPIDKIGIS